MTLNKLCDEWLETYQKDHIKVQTYVRYRCIINNYIRDSIGNKEIKRFDRRSVQEYMTWLKNYQSPRTGHKLASSTVNMCLTVLKMVFGYAVDFEILKSDPTLKVRGATNNKTSKVKCFTVEEQAKIEEYIEGLEGDEQKGIILDLYTGLRIGELMALTWNDIDFDSGILNINKTVYTSLDENGNWRTITDSPKTRTSNREIPLSDDMLLMLMEMKERSNSEFILSHEDGEPISQRLYRWRFNKMLDDLGIRHLNFHALRHTFATRAIESGMDVKTLSEILGHSNAAVTLNVYTHSMTAHKRQMMNGLTRVGKLK